MSVRPHTQAVEHDGEGWYRHSHSPHCCGVPLSPSRSTPAPEERTTPQTLDGWSGALGASPASAGGASSSSAPGGGGLLAGASAAMGAAAAGAVSNVAVGVAAKELGVSTGQAKAGMQ